MIRNWCDALGDTNPIYVDSEAAVRNGFTGLVAPPAMLRTWTMLSPAEQLKPVATDAPTVYDLLEEKGFTAKAGTNCDHTFVRYLTPDDEVSASTRLVAVSAEKRTALGPGYFLDTRTTYRDGSYAIVAEMMWRSLRYRPESQPAPPTRPVAVEPPELSELTAPGRPVVSGQRLPTEEVAITPRLIIGGAMASRDYQSVHHDRDYARTQGVPDYFMNMMTSAGLVSRYTTDWAGPAAKLRTLNLTLGVPNHPGDNMHLNAVVHDVQSTDSRTRLIGLVVTGMNSLGRHLQAEVTLSIPVAGRRWD